VRLRCNNNVVPGTTAVNRLDLRRLVRSLFSLRLAIAVGIVLSARLSWLFSHAAKWDTPAPIPALILCELPMLFCVVALMNGEQSKRTLRAAGIAFGIALSFCIIWLPLGFFAGLIAWEDRTGYLAQLDQFLWPCLALALWMLIVAWRCGKGQRRAFAGSGLMGVAYFVLTLVLIHAASVTGSGEAKEKLRFQQVTQFPDVHIRAVAACLIRHHLLHPDEGFPSSNTTGTAQRPSAIRGPYTSIGFTILPSIVLPEDFRTFASHRSFPTTGRRDYPWSTSVETFSIWLEPVSLATNGSDNISRYRPWMLTTSSTDCLGCAITLRFT